MPKYFYERKECLNCTRTYCKDGKYYNTISVLFDDEKCDINCAAYTKEKLVNLFDTLYKDDKLYNSETFKMNMYKIIMKLK